jgi:hypothetical protein
MPTPYTLRQSQAFHIMRASGDLLLLEGHRVGEQAEEARDQYLTELEAVDRAIIRARTDARAGITAGTPVAVRALEAEAARGIWQGQQMVADQLQARHRELCYRLAAAGPWGQP